MAGSLAFVGTAAFNIAYSTRSGAATAAFHNTGCRGWPIQPLNLALPYIMLAKERSD